MAEYGPGSSGAVFKYRKTERSSRCDAKDLQRQKTGMGLMTIAKKPYEEDSDFTVEESMELLREELKKELPDLEIE